MHTIQVGKVVMIRQRWDWFINVVTLSVIPRPVVESVAFIVAGEGGGVEFGASAFQQSRHSTGAVHLITFVCDGVGGELLRRIVRELLHARMVI